MNQRTDSYELGDFRLDPLARVVTLRDEPVALAPKTFDLLLLLVEGRGRVLERAELIRSLWPDTVVEEANLTFQISTLRKALGEDGSRWIETAPKHGYRFVGPVRVISRSGEPAEPVPMPSRSRAGRTWILIAVAAVVVAAVVVAAFPARGWLRRNAPVSAPVPSAPWPLTTYRGWEGDPTLSPDGSQVAFSWSGPGDDNLDIYLKLVGPGEPRRLTTDREADFAPAWSADGRHIAFLRDRPDGRYAIVVIPALGGAERQVAEIDLTDFRSAPGKLLAWTPDGRWLAAAGRFGPADRSEVWLLSAETGERRRLTTVGAGSIGDYGVSFSPDGRFVALLRFATRSVGDVYLLPLGADYSASGPPLRLTHEERLVGGPAWSAGGDRLFYSSGGALGYRTLRMLAVDLERPGRRVEPVPLPAGEHATALSTARRRLVYARGERDTNVWRLSAAGGEATALLASTLDEHNPDFSPDGARIAFTSTRSGTEEIWVARADGTEPTQMTAVGGPNTSNPRWSPDGGSLLFNSRRSGSSDLYVLGVATGAITRLTDDPADEYEPRWSRDGASIYFVSTRTGRTEVWRMPSRGGEAVQVTRQGGGAAVESPDGRWLYYAKDSQPMSIWRIPVDGGEATHVLDGLSYGFNFAVTEPGIYFMALREAGASIEFFDLSTRRTTVLHRLDRPFWFGFALSPDARSILFSKVDSRGSDLMVFENMP